jgi:predicted dehydrogenase
MRNLLDAADKVGPYQIAAVSDVYAPHRDAVKERSNGVATTHLDYREVLEQDIDALLIASPDHWHVRMAVDALAAGKDVYLEKPVTHTIEEGATLTRAVRSSKQILQCGMQQRSWTHFRDAALIQAGRAHPAGANLLVAELSPGLGAQAHRPTGARLEVLARIRS